MNTFQCPECGYANNFGATACSSCLLIFEKHNKKVEGHTLQINGGPRLESLWQQILSQYENLELHEQFVKQSFAEKALPFSSQQYRHMLELNPHDGMALKMRDKIIQMATVTFAMPQRPRPKSSRAFRNLFVLAMTVVLVFILFTFFRIKK